MLNMLLLLLIVLLLLLLILMQATGWPSGRRNDSEQLRRELLRELAGQRAESARNLHEVKVELESLFREGADDEKSALLLNRIEQAIMQLQATAAGTRKKKPKKSTDEYRFETPCPEEGEEGERLSGVKNPLLFQRQYALFPFDAPEGAAVSVDASETEEYLSVPAADFDPDLDPPYDPDAQAGSGEPRRL